MKKCVNILILLVLFTYLSSAVSLDPLQTDFVLCYTMDSSDVSAGTIQDYSPESNDGRVTNLSFVKGKINESAYFSGLTGRINSTTTLPFSLLEPRTFAFWGKINYTRNQPFFSSGLYGATGMDWGLIYNTNPTLRLGVPIYGPDYWTQYAPQNNSWILYIITYDGSKVRVYTNLTQRGTDYPRVLYTPFQTLLIGSHISNLNYYLHGHIDEFMVWNRELNSSERSLLYNSGDGLSCSNISQGDDDYWFNIFNFSTTTNVQIWYLNFSVYKSTTSYLRLRTNQFSDPFRIYFNNQTQIIEFSNPVNTPGIHLYNISVKNGTTHPMNFLVTSSEGILENALVSAYINGNSSLSYAKLTSKLGKATLYLNENAVYYVCASKTGYSQTSTSCKVMGPQEFESTSTVSLFLTTATGITHLTTPYGTQNLTPPYSRVNMSLVTAQFDTPTKQRIGLFLILVICFVFGIIFENKIQGSGISAFTLGLLMFSSVFRILLLPFAILMIYHIYNTYKGLST